jgi:alkylated DNA repair dioxygenase AlkB
MNPNNFPCSYDQRFFQKTDADKYFTYLLNTIERKQYRIKMFGKHFLQPRKISYFADEGICYSYSKTRFYWSWRDEQMYLIKTNIEQYTWYTFNSVLCNLYRDGQDSMWWHADDEKELWDNPVIASVSFWQERKIHFRQKNWNGRVSFVLYHGSLLLMKEWSQVTRQHAIHKSKSILWVRINLTFRNILQ